MMWQEDSIIQTIQEFDTIKGDIMQTMTQDKKDELLLMANIFVNVTLNGEPAVIRGRLLDYPIVVSAMGQAEYSLEAVDRILAVGGDFEY